jgi:lipopolysaccharide transport system permease protein
MTTLAEYRSSRELFNNLTLRELRSKYKRSFLGWTWSMVNPLVNTLVYTVLFAVLFGAVPPPGGPSHLNVYALYLLCALLPWNFFQNSVMSSVGSLVGNANLIKKTYFPRELMPASSVAAALVSHLIEMGLVLVVLLCFGDYWALEWLPMTVVLIGLTAIFGVGFGLIASVLNVYFRDIEHFLQIFFLLWLYASPIVYPITVVEVHNNPQHTPRYFPGTHIHLLTVLKLNPMTDMSILFRDTMFYGHAPDWLALVYYAVWSFALLVVGLKVFGRLEGRLAEEL